jgi:phage-related protein
MAKYTLEELQVIISANADQFKGEFIKLNQQLAKLQTTATSAGAGVEKSLFPSMFKAQIAAAAFTKGLQLMQQGLQKMEAMFVDSVQATGKFESALIGLSTVAGRRLGSDAIPKATQAAKDLAVDGLMTVTDAATGLKNLLASGFNLDEAIRLMRTFKDAAAFGRQGSLSFGEAVSSATEGIKNGNSILVDNAGITKNLSNILVEAGYSQQDLNRATSDAGVRQALYNGILKEGLIFQGDAAKLAGTTQGQLASIGATLTNLRVAVGEFLKPIQSVLQSGFIQLLQGIGQSFAGTEASIRGFTTRVAGYLLAMFRVIGAVLSRIPIIGKNFAGLANLTIQSGASMASLADNTSAYGSAASQAADDTKKLNKELNQLAAFDEMNVLNPPSGSGADTTATPNMNIGGGAGALPGFDAAGVNETADDVISRLKDIADALNAVWDLTGVSNFMQGFRGFFDQLMPYIEGIVENLGELFGGIGAQFLDTWNTYAPQIGASISGLFSSIWDDLIKPYLKLIAMEWEMFTQDLLDVWNEYGASIFDGVGEFITNLVNVFKRLWDEIYDPIVKPFLEQFEKTWAEHINPMIKKALEFVAVLVDGALQILNKFVMPLVNGIITVLKPAFVSMLATVTGVFNTLLSFISDFVGGVFSTLKGLVNFIVGVFTGDWQRAWDGVRSIFQTFANTLGSVIKLPLNLIIDAINGFIAGLNTIKVPDWVPVVGGKGISIARIPKLAEGGVVNSATIAQIGEAGREVVLPLENNTQWMDVLANKLSDLGGQGHTIILNVGGEKIYEGFVDFINDKAKATNSMLLNI